MKLLSKILLQGVFLLIFIACSVQVYGETKTSIASGNWNTPAIWSPAGVPVNNDDVIIGTGTVVAVDVNTEIINSLTIQSDATLQGDGTGWVLLIGGAAGIDFVNNGTFNASGANSVVVRLSSNSEWSGTGPFNCSTIDLNGSTLSFASSENIVLNLSGTPDPFLNPGSVVPSTSVTFNYNGSSEQIISGSAIVNFNSLVVSNPAGVILAANTTINGILNLNTGIVTTNANRLIISSTGSVTRSNGHVNGNLQKYISAGATLINYEIGDITAYSPVSLHFDSVTTPGNLTAISNSSDHPFLSTSSLDGSKSVNRYWTLSNMGIVFSSYNATFNFVSSDIDAGANTDSFIVDKYSGSSWNRTQTGLKTATSTQILNVSDFSDFAIGEIKNYSIIASTSTHGTINPSGTISVSHGMDQLFTITPNIGCYFDSITVDGLHVDSTTSYTFKNVSTDHSISAYFSATQQTLTVTATNGIITKNPDQTTYDYGTIVQLTATPNTGYHFVNWSGDASGSTNPLTITMDGDKNITANFAVNTYTLTVNATNGSVVKNPDQPTYNHGTSVQLTATPDPGYHFVDWSGDASGSTNPLTITMDGNRNITANFAINTYTLTVNATNGSVVKNPDQPTYNHGTSVQMTATPDPGYHFVDWSGDASGSTNPLTITMDGNKTITANFAINTYTLTVNATNGSVVKDPDQTAYNYGTSVQLTATPDPGYHFVDWSGDASGPTNPLTITMDGNKNITANFVINTYTLTTSATTHGGISPEGIITVNHGMDQLFTITPDIGCYLDSLTVDGLHVDSTTSYTFINIITDHSISAYFSITTYTLTVSATNGSITKNPDQTTYDIGTSVQLTATPTPGYHFVNWSGDASGSTNPLTITMDGNKNITANFAINVYTLTVNATNGSVAKNPDQPTYNHGTSVQLTATPEPGYHFVNWSGDASGSTNPLTVTMDGNKNITANFAINTYTLTINATNGSVTKNPDQPTYNHGTSVQLTATPASGYHFVNWSGDTSGSTNPLTITMDVNKNITANFAINTYTLTINATNGSVAKNPDQSTYNHGTAVQLTATPNTGYNFVNWSGDASGGTNPLTITMDGNKNITANFAINTYTLTTSATNGTINRNPNQASYAYGTTVQLTATPNTGYHFVSWSGDASGSTNPLSITMDGNKNITANFAINTYTLTITATNGSVTKIPNQVTYNHGTTVQLTATPNSGYRFANWSGDASGSANPITITMNGNKNITANFIANTYTLTVNATNGTVTKLPNQTSYDYGTAVQLTATPNTGYHFVSWGGSASGSTNPLTITMDGNKIINASFAINAYTLTVTATNGSITKNPNQATYNHGTSVRLTAIPNTGYHFVNWSGDINSSANPLNITMNSDRNIIANFEINTYTVSVSVLGNGSVTINPDQLIYEHGSIVQLTAIPSDTSWSFSRWSGDLVSTSNPVTFIVDNVKNITATFAPNTAYAVMYRTITAENLALDRDNKGKLNKFVKRKPDKVEFRFSMIADSVRELTLEFSKDIRNLDIVKDTSGIQGKFNNTISGHNGNSLQAYAGDTLYKNIFFGTIKKIYVKLEPSTSLMKGDTIIVHGFCAADDPVKVKYCWLGSEIHYVPYFILNKTRLPMPNRVNILYETFIQGGFYGTGGLTVGLSRFDSSKYYGWFQTPRYSDVLRTLIVSKTSQLHNGRPRGFDITWNGKILLNQLKILPPTKHDNILLSKIIALKLNIFASAMGKIPRGFGELIYGDETDNPLNGMMVKEIAHYGDVLITGVYRSDLLRKLFATSAEFENIAQTIHKINESFEGPLDTVAFKDSLVFKGIKPLRSVSYLHANPFETQTIITPLTLNISETPGSYTLYQNYPNPFNPTTTIEFDLQDDAIVTLKVYNILGQEVVTLIDHELMDAGFQDVEFNALNLASGVYLYRLIADEAGKGGIEGTKFMLVKKMILVK